MGNKIKSSAKHGRNRKSGQNTVYKAEKRREKSHVTRIQDHLKRFGLNDRKACDDLLRYGEAIGLEALRKARNFLDHRRQHAS